MWHENYPVRGNSVRSCKQTPDRDKVNIRVVTEVKTTLTLNLTRAPSYQKPNIISNAERPINSLPRPSALAAPLTAVICT